jgi:hypothetical protein
MKRSEFHGASVLARRLKGREAGKNFKKQMKHKKNKATGSVTGYCPAGSPVISKGARPRARTGLNAAAVGTTTRTTAGLPIGTTTVRPTATIISVSVLSAALNDGHLEPGASFSASQRESEGSSGASRKPENPGRAKFWIMENREMNQWNPLNVIITLSIFCLNVKNNKVKRSKHENDSNT